MSDTSIIALINMAGTIMGVVLTGFITYILAQQRHKAELVTKSLNNIEIVSAATHTLVNSASLVQLRLNAMLSRRVAEFPGASQEDKEAAKVAEELYQEHKKRQEAVDKFPAVAQAMNNIKGKS